MAGERYKVRLHFEGIGTWDASVDNANHWQLPDDAAPEDVVRTGMADAISTIVDSSLQADPPAYLPVFDMRYAIQALTAFPGSEPLFEIPVINVEVVSY